MTEPASELYSESVAVGLRNGSVLEEFSIGHNQALRALARHLCKVIYKMVDEKRDYQMRQNLELRYGMFYQTVLVME